MRMRRYVAGKALVVDWYPRAAVSAPEAPARPIARLPQRPSQRRRHAGAA
jgi:hypothetical protein